MRRYFAVSLTVRRLCMEKNSQHDCYFIGPYPYKSGQQWARYFAQLSIINFRTDVNSFLSLVERGILTPPARRIIVGLYCQALKWRAGPPARSTRKHAVDSSTSL